MSPPLGFSTDVDFDPAYPEVFFQMVKWYWAPQSLARKMLELYPTSTDRVDL